MRPDLLHDRENPPSPPFAKGGIGVVMTIGFVCFNLPLFIPPFVKGGQGGIFQTLMSDLTQANQGA